MKMFPASHFGHFRLLLVLFLWLFCSNLIAQKTEWLVRAGSGWFNYVGDDAQSQTFLNRNDKLGITYLNHRRGAKAGWSGELEFIARRVTKKRLVYGLGAGYASLESRIAIIGVRDSVPYPAKGNGYYRTNYINLNPFMGYRWPGKKILVDLVAGMDLGLPLNGTQRGSATIPQTGETVPVNNDKTNYTNEPGTLGALRLKLDLHYRKWGVDMGYASGIWLSRTRVLGGPDYPIRTGFARLGLSYQLN